ncbi:MAG TPA: CRISPR-associated endonuclease Cas1, partial [Xanthomonadaceae bacterium]|nr:CRISPR-associated endonuclease Cas1 [Xanthomonadaceae bacterium]
GRHGDDVAWLGAGLSTSGALRRRQHLAHADPAARVAHARWVLKGKIAAMRAELDNGWLAQASRVETTLVRAEGSLELSGSTASLNGVEGALAADWFGAMAASVEPAWDFTGRNRRPPRDPLNALLSYGYALAGAEALTAVQRLGFDPAVGFLHEMYPGRHALALDALECLRPMVDALAVRLLWSDLDPVQFRADSARGCRLDKDARLAVVKGWHALREQGASAALSRWTHALRQRLGAGGMPEAEGHEAQSNGGPA